MNIPAKCMPRRKKCAATTREAILAAAHQRFLAESYEAVGLRDVARAASVDVALVSRYFGSKEELFKEVLRGCGDGEFEPDVGAAELPAYFLSLLSNRDGDDRQHHRDKLLIMLRSASSATASEVIQDSFQADVLEPLAAQIGGREGQAKAVLSMALLIGMNFLKTVLPVEPLSGEERDSIEQEFVHLMQFVLEGREAG